MSKVIRTIEEIWKNRGYWYQEPLLRFLVLVLFLPYAACLWLGIRGWIYEVTRVIAIAAVGFWIFGTALHFADGVRAARYELMLRLNLRRVSKLQVKIASGLERLDYDYTNGEVASLNRQLDRYTATMQSFAQKVDRLCSSTLPINRGYLRKVHQRLDEQLEFWSQATSRAPASDPTVAKLRKAADRVRETQTFLDKAMSQP